MSIALNQSIRNIYVPLNMRDRPLDARGYLVPYFVAWLDEQGNNVAEPGGTPDFRVLDRKRWARCVRDNVCWLCGKPMGKHKAFVLGPMCAITRTTSEPPSHLGCAHYAVQVCPFLTRPRMRRNDKDMPANHIPPPGFMIERNPGVSVIWTTQRFSLFTPSQKDGPLITVGDPISLEWWREGRRATRAEARESVESGLPALRETAEREGRFAVEALERQYIPRLEALLPP